MKCAGNHREDAGNTAPSLPTLARLWTGIILLGLLLGIPFPRAGMASGSDSVPAESSTTANWVKDHLRLSGWLETVHGIRLQSPDEVITSRVQTRLEASADWAPFYGFLSMNAEKNWIVRDNSRLEPHEVWLEYVADAWSLRLGRQIITWGKADGLRITDNICPVDYSDFMNRSLDDIRIPVTAALLRVTKDALVTDIVWIPEFRPAVFPDSNTPWGALFSLSDSPMMRQRDTQLPPFSLENSEIGIRTAGYFTSFDISASVFYTWDDLPVYDSRILMTPAGPQLEIQPEHKRVTILGLDLSVPWSDFVFRAEGAMFLGKSVTALTPGDSLRQKDVLKWLVGVDWSPGDDWTITAQLSDEHILLHEEELNAKAHRHIGTLNISKKLLNQTLTLSSLTYVMPDDDAWASRFQAEYSLMDGMAITAGIDIIDGGDGIYRQVHKNSQLWMKLRYSF